MDAPPPRLCGPPGTATAAMGKTHVDMPARRQADTPTYVYAQAAWRLKHVVVLALHALLAVLHDLAPPGRQDRLELLTPLRVARLCERCQGVALRRSQTERGIGVGDPAVPADLHERIRGLQKEYDAHQHEIAGAANADLTERWGLTEFLRDRFGIAGTPDDCVAQVRRAMAAGARQFIITAFVPDVRALMRRFMREVAAAVGSPR